jgi:putative copper export protein
MLIAPVRLYAQARGLVVAGDPVFPMMRNVMRTTWGRGWILQTVASFGVLCGFLLVQRGWRAGWWLAIVAALAATLSPALMGHAIAAERFLMVSLLADWIHVAMAGAWLGSLAMLALLARTTHAAGSAANASLATLIDLFHPVALACSAVLVATGVVSLVLRVEHLGDLLDSAYGAILAIKLALTLGVAALGLHHARRGAALVRLGEAPGVARSLVMEAALAAMVVATTAVLVGTSPPMRMSMPMAFNMPSNPIHSHLENGR